MENQIDYESDNESVSEPGKICYVNQHVIDNIKVSLKELNIEQLNQILEEIIILMRKSD
jgi:hypothetical protein